MMSAILNQVKNCIFQGKRLPGGFTILAEGSPRADSQRRNSVRHSFSTPTHTKRRRNREISIYASQPALQWRLGAPLAFSIVLINTLKRSLTEATRFTSTTVIASP
jgi:hypothetical protein